MVKKLILLIIKDLKSILQFIDSI